jgi:hypothetical protein
MSTQTQPRETLEIDADWDVWLVREGGPDDDAACLFLGHVTRCARRVPDHLEAEHGRLLDEYRGAAAAEADYREEADHHWNRR